MAREKNEKSELGLVGLSSSAGSQMIFYSLYLIITRSQETTSLYPNISGKNLFPNRDHAASCVSISSFTAGLIVIVTQVRFLSGASGP
jgi:hypothetical protein